MGGKEGGTGMGEGKVGWGGDGVKRVGMRGREGGAGMGGREGGAGMGGRVGARRGLGD